MNQEKCKNCENLENGSIIKTDKNGNCPFCNRNISRFYTYPKELPKGVCPSCWGKKFNSVMTRQVGYPDFPGDKGFDTGSYVENVPCSKCNGTGLFPSPKEEIVNDWEKEIEEQFIEILDYGNDLTSEDVWTDVEKIQWLRKSMKSLISSTEKRVKEEERKKVMKDIHNIIWNENGSLKCHDISTVVSSVMHYFIR